MWRCLFRLSLFSALEDRTIGDLGIQQFLQILRPALRLHRFRETGVLLKDLLRDIFTSHDFVNLFWNDGVYIELIVEGSSSKFRSGPAKHLTLIKAERPSSISNSIIFPMLVGFLRRRRTNSMYLHRTRTEWGLPFPCKCLSSTGKWWWKPLLCTRKVPLAGYTSSTTKPARTSNH